MNPRIASFLRFRISRLLERVTKLEHESRKQSFRKQVSRPWSLGYDEHKWEFISSIINNQEHLASFANNIEPLPKNFGMGLDERAIEYPWVISLLQGLHGTLLDAGSTLNYTPLVHHPAIKSKTCIIVNLNPEKYCFWKEGISYVFGDICALPFKDSIFDVITCISTLEHVGMNNEIYTGPAEAIKNTEGYRKALLELKRVLKPGGTLLITIPFGTYQDFGFFQQFDETMVNDVIQTFGGHSSNVRYYQYASDGWTLSKAHLCADLKYFNVHETKYFDAQSTKDFDEDGAAAARAVACIQLIK